MQSANKHTAAVKYYSVLTHMEFENYCMIFTLSLYLFRIYPFLSNNCPFEIDAIYSVKVDFTEFHIFREINLLYHWILHKNYYGDVSMKYCLVFPHCVLLLLQCFSRLFVQIFRHSFRTGDFYIGWAKSFKVQTQCVTAADILSHKTFVTVIFY